MMTREQWKEFLQTSVAQRDKEEFRKGWMDWLKDKGNVSTDKKGLRYEAWYEADELARDNVLTADEWEYRFDDYYWDKIHEEPDHCTKEIDDTDTKFKIGQKVRAVNMPNDRLTVKKVFLDRYTKSVVYQVTFDNGNALFTSRFYGASELESTE